MTVTPHVLDDPQTLGITAARLIADRIEAAAGRAFLLGCPGGRSAASTYVALAAEVAARELDLSRLVVVMMDDYLVPDGGDHAFRREDPAAPHSCERFGREHIVEPLDEAAGAGRSIAPESFWLPDPGDPAAYDARIAEHGGIDLFILATGASDGHIAFNPPGSTRESRTRVVELPESTRRDNLSTFPTFGGDLDRVPTHGVTVGLGTIKDLSKEVLMLVHGSDKRYAVERLTSVDAFDPSWPASIFVECANPHLLVDASTLADAHASTH